MMQLQLTLSFLFAAAAIFLLSTQHERRTTQMQFAKIPDLTKIDQRIQELQSWEKESDSIRVKTEALRISIWQKVIISALVSFFVFLILSVGFAQAALLSFGVGIGAFLTLDFLLSREVKRQREQVDLEFPAIMELLTLAIGAGQAPLSAVKYIAERSSGKLHEHLLHVIGDVRAGQSLHSSLDRLGAHTNSALVRQFVDATVSALIRGTPLAEVLQRQVFEVRNLYHRQVLERAGKAEISMMVPIVFLILPISILFALWPSLSHLNLMAG
jgi:tight adherence protein C